MKTTTKDNKTSNSHSSKPFFNKGGEGSFFSQTDETKEPFFTPSPILPKLTFGQSGDEFEQEADTMADRVVGMDSTTKNDTQKLNTQKMNVENKELTHTKPVVMKSSNERSVTSPDLGTQLNNSKGKGQPLSKDLNSSMSNAFSTDFSKVKIHTNNDSIQMNQNLNARAFSNGSDIYFNKGEYNPNTKEGKHLLAHELTHVIQQGAATKQSPSVQGIQRQLNEDEAERTTEGSRDPSPSELKTMIIVKKGPVTPISKPSSTVEENIELGEEGLQRKKNGVPDIQRVVDPATVGAAVAVTAMTYTVFKDLIGIEKGDIDYTFDRMKGQKYPNNNKNWEQITNWKSTFWDIHYIYYHPWFNYWAVGMEVRLNWEYNGYGLSGIYFTKRDFWDKPTWGGDFKWLIQPLMATRKDKNGHPVAQVKIIADVTVTKTFRSDKSRTKTWIIDAEGGGK